MQGRESDLVAKYKGEHTETSSVADEEMKSLLERAGIRTEDLKEYETIGGKKVEVKREVKGGMPPMPKPEDMEKARKTPEYAEFSKIFEEKYATGNLKPRQVEDIARKLDNKFQILQEHSKEVDRHDCDMMLYKNRIQKDLGDVMNDLRESYNIILILMDDRTRLKDLFAIFNIQIKGLNALNKSLEEDLASRDTTIEKLKRALEAAQNEVEKLKSQLVTVKRERDEKVIENNAQKRTISEQKGEIIRLSKQNENYRDEIARLRKEVERLKGQLKTKIDELEKVKAELPILRDESKKLNIKNGELTDENERLKREIEHLKEEMKPLIEDLKATKADNKELQTVNLNLKDALRNTENDYRQLMKEAKDLKPDNDKLTKQVEELNNNVNELLNECSGLRKKPQELMDEYEPKLMELKTTCNDLKDGNEKLSRENELMKRDLNEIMEERKRRNADRRKRKEEQMKRIVDEAHKKLEDSRKKMDEKRGMIDSTEIVKSTVITQEDLKKYPEYQVSHEPLEPDEEEEVTVITEVQVDTTTLEEPITLYSRPPGRKQDFEVSEPYSFERAPYQTIALEPEQLLSLAPPEILDEPLFIQDPYCPYGHGPAPPPPVEEVKRELPKISDIDIRLMIDRRLRRLFFMTRVPPNKMSATLQKDEEVKVLNNRYEEILDTCLPIISPYVHNRGFDDNPEECVHSGIDEHLEEIREMFRKRKEVEEEPEIMTPTSAEKVGGVKIMQMIKSTQRDEVKEFRKVEAGKVTWNKTHFIFAIDGSGSMRGRRAKAVEQGFERCVSLLKPMKEIIVSSYTFDDKCTDHIKMLEPAAALKVRGRMPLTYGDKTDYMSALGKVIQIIESDTTHPDYLLAIIFMSDGKGGYPEDQVATLMKIKESGRKMMLFTLACETEEDEDLYKMAKTMGGEHYKVIDAEAMKTAFMKIIGS